MATGGACAAVAAINSFIFLQRTHPDLYVNRLTPSRTGDENTSFTDAFAFAEGTWQVGTNPERKGYYSRFPGNPDSLYMDTKVEWINDHAPGTTVFDSMYVGNGGRPTIDWLAKEILDGEDVEFFINTDANDFYHALTLVGIKCDAAGGCAISFSDPNDPTTLFNRDLTPGAGGRLEFDDPFGGAGKTVFIDAAFSESAVPEPAVFFLLAAVFGGFVIVKVRRTNRQRVTSS